ncbi:MAG: hypothetical protein IPO05_17010 [Flavobacteriales bacterium]|jgi:hypothetical protein|nr:hypothetical protein [Flavobacteriales bacterium]
MRIALMLLAFGLCFLGNAQTPGADGPFYPEKLHEDLEYMRSVLHRAHPDPYRYVTKAELDRGIDAIRDGIVVPLDRHGFLDLVLPMLHLVGDAHLTLDLPGDQRGWLRNDVPVIPLKVKVLGKSIFLEEELKGFRSLPVGAEILSINGHDARVILDRVGKHIPVDGSNTTLRQRRIESDFPWLFRRFVDASNNYEVAYRTNDGVQRTQRIFAMTGLEMDRSRKPTGGAMLPWRVFWDAESEAVWFTLRTLDLDSLERAEVQPDKFIAAMLKDTRRNKARTMVLDVRGAGGRDLASAELVFAAIAQQPFRVIQGMTVRTIDPLEGPLSALPQAHVEMVRDQFVPGPNGISHLRPDDHRLQSLPKMKKAFQGKVYVVCDGATRDAGAAFVMLAKRTGRARIVGEEVGSNALSFTGGRELVTLLPHSGLELQVPLMRYVPDGMPSGPLDHGERAHHEVEQQPWGIAKGKDTLREALLELIRELR